MRGEGSIVTQFQRWLANLLVKSLSMHEPQKLLDATPRKPNTAAISINRLEEEADINKPQFSDKSSIQQILIRTHMPIMSHDSEEDSEFFQESLLVQFAVHS